MTIIDQNGNVLSKTGDKGSIGSLSPDLLAYQAQVEHRLETRAQALLDKSPRFEKFHGEGQRNPGFHPN